MYLIGLTCIVFDLGNSFSILRTHPQFQHRKHVIQQNPQLTAVPQQIDQRYPRLPQLISQTQTSFVRLLNDPTATQGSNLPNVSNGGAGTVSAGNFPMESRITCQVMERIERVSI